jgi:integrase
MIVAICAGSLVVAAFSVLTFATSAAAECAWVLWARLSDNSFTPVAAVEDRQECVPRAKAGARPVMVSESARKLLQGQLEAHDGPWVFPKPNGRPYSREQVGEAFRRSARAAGLKDFHFHDLRHHGATMVLNKGFTAPIVMTLGGWKTERLMRRYAAVTDQT